MMKILKRFLAVVLCLVLMQAPLHIVTQPVEVQAAAREGLYLDKRTDKYYFYEDGKKVTNAWRTYKGNKYFFTKKGYAYASERFDDVQYNIVVKKIGDKYYGFNHSARMVKGLYLTIDGKIYYFDTKTGAYDANKTKRYRDASKEKNTSTRIKNLLGKPQKIKKVNSCYDQNGMGYIHTYSHYTLEVFRYDNGREIVTGLWPR